MTCCVQMVRFSQSFDDSDMADDEMRRLSSKPPLAPSGGSVSLAAQHFCPVCGIIATSQDNLEVLPLSLCMVSGRHASTSTTVQYHENRAAETYLCYGSAMKGKHMTCPWAESGWSLQLWIWVPSARGISLSRHQPLLHKVSCEAAGMPDTEDDCLGKTACTLQLQC